MRKQWDDWGWVVAVLAAFAAFIGLMYGSGVIFKRDTWCVVGGTDPCFREWVSALGGWAAVVAAVPTVLFLSKQVRDADRHHRQGSRIQMRHARALAVRTDLAAQGIEGVCSQLTATLGEGGRTPANSLENLRISFEDLKSRLQATEFQRFEDEISVGEFETNGAILKQLEEALMALSGLRGKYTDDEWIPYEDSSTFFLQLIVRWVADYTRECRERASEFLVEYAEMTA